MDCGARQEMKTVLERLNQYNESAINLEDSIAEFIKKLCKDNEGKLEVPYEETILVTNKLGELVRDSLQGIEMVGDKIIINTTNYQEYYDHLITEDQLTIFHALVEWYVDDIYDV